MSLSRNHSGAVGRSNAQMSRLLWVLLAVGALLAGAYGCEEPGPLEKAGKQADQAAEEAREAITVEDDRVDDVIDDLRDAKDEAVQAVRETVDDIKKKVTKKDS